MLRSDLDGVVGMGGLIAFRVAKWGGVSDGADEDIDAG